MEPSRPSVSVCNYRIGLVNQQVQCGINSLLNVSLHIRNLTSYNRCQTSVCKEHHLVSKPFRKILHNYKFCHRFTKINLLDDNKSHEKHLKTKPFSSKPIPDLIIVFKCKTCNASDSISYKILHLKISSTWSIRSNGTDQATTWPH